MSTSPSTLSTGPRTPEGKKRSSLNAIRHGLFAESPVLPGEDPAAFEAFREACVNDLAPSGVIEETLVTTIASTQWRIARCSRIERSILGAEDLDAERQIDGLCRFSLYEGRLTRKFNQTFKELRLIQAERKTLEQAQLLEAVDIAAECKACQLSFEPTEFGFVFTAAEIQTALRRRDLLESAKTRKAGPRTT